MAIPVLPPSAPFNSEQRAWLNGFLAAVLYQESECDGAVAYANDERSLNRIGSDSGGDTIVVPPTSAAALNGSASAGDSAHGDDFLWHDPALELDERMEMVQNEPLPLQLMAAMAQLDCGQCGYLCNTYAAAIADGSEKSLKKCVPGEKATANKLKELMAAS